MYVSMYVSSQTCSLTRSQSRRTPGHPRPCELSTIIQPRAKAGAQRERVESSSQIIKLFSDEGLDFVSNRGRGSLRLGTRCRRGRTWRRLRCSPRVVCWRGRGGWLRCSPRVVCWRGGGGWLRCSPRVVCWRGGGGWVRGRGAGRGFQRGHADYSHLTEFKIRWWAIDDRAVCPV